MKQKKLSFKKFNKSNKSIIVKTLGPNLKCVCASNAAVLGHINNRVNE